VSAYSEDGDVILAAPLKPFKYYYRGPHVTYSPLWSPTFYEQMIASRVRGFQRAWLVLGREWGMDPEGRIKGYMKSTFPTMRETTFTNLYLGGFDLTPIQGERGTSVSGGQKSHEPSFDK
jgi:hypothetical protein